MPTWKLQFAPRVNTAVATFELLVAHPRGDEGAETGNSNTHGPQGCPADLPRFVSDPLHIVDPNHSGVNHELSPSRVRM